MKAVLLTLLALAVSPAEQHRPIEMRTRPAICFQPCSVRAIVRIEPHPLNRWWVIQMEGSMEIGSVRQLEGEQSAITQPEVWFKDLPVGEYVVVAVVYRQQEKSEAGRAVSRVSVLGDR